jgi:hypothetical protein
MRSPLDDFRPGRRVRVFSPGPFGRSEHDATGILTEETELGAWWVLLAGNQLRCYGRGELLPEPTLERPWDRA